MIFRDLYTTEYEAPSYFLHIADWPSYLVMQGVHVFQSLGGRRGERKKERERCILFIVPCYILCMLLKASTARCSCALSGAGSARTVRLRTGYWGDAMVRLSLASPQRELLHRVVSVGSNFAGGSIWPRAANTRAASSCMSNQHWIHLLQRHKPLVILLLICFSRTFPLLLRLFQSRT